MTKFRENYIYKAKVTVIEKYGVFASLNEEYSGLIHISELYDGYVNDISEFLEVGQVVNVKIIDMSKKNNQLRLSALGVGNNFTINKKSKIKESVFGFYLLKLALPKWIDKKIKEIDKKS